MVDGLAVFGEHFSAFTDNYVLIGGSACDLAMTSVGQDFRATKDLDIVLFLEQNNAGFISRFWEFIFAGNYTTKQRADQRPQYYRFADPSVDGYPSMLELFSARPETLDFKGDGHLVPIPASEEISSLSAILLDTSYSTWIRNGKLISNNISYTRAEHLIPLKAKAWLELSKRKLQTGDVDDRHIKKHKNDVFRLLTIVEPDYQTNVPASIVADMQAFIESMAIEPLDLKNLKIKGVSQNELLDLLSKVYLP